VPRISESFGPCFEWDGLAGTWTKISHGVLQTYPNGDLQPEEGNILIKKSQFFATSFPGGLGISRAACPKNRKEANCDRTIAFRDMTARTQT
jgi:hypothetical protein